MDGEVYKSLTRLFNEVKRRELAKDQREAFIQQAQLKGFSPQEIEEFLQSEDEIDDCGLL